MTEWSSKTAKEALQDAHDKGRELMERENPCWTFSRKHGAKPVPINDAARIIDLQVENDALQRALQSALLDVKIRDLQLAECREVIAGRRI